MNTMSTQDCVKDYYVDGKKLKTLIYVDKALLEPLIEGGRASVSMEIHFSFNKKNSRVLGVLLELLP